ncbi:conserved Plasmodium protein, unknown function [Plasmodium gallinaceum]|uniref:Uncharacterized protein n=1 Tax=Plasmodium gallinaceum TaxID=5849 RepID=A0A1J1GWR9_PLAGA|nr:conserved Plasmodium protein, unknown function [Plasmodium gallinaceum]CRG96884.1 conserved Plasmodium protein, unknown function [Plasmodium gallinaceum]
MNKNKIVITLFKNIKCFKYLSISKSYFHILFTNENKGNKFLNFKNMTDFENKKIVLLDIESENRNIRKKINRTFIGSILLSSITICLIELNLIYNIYGYIVSVGLIIFFTIYLLFYNSLILRAVLDYENKNLLLYPFTLLKRNNLKKQIIISLHEIKKINKLKKYIQLHLKKEKSVSIFNFIPLHIPRYNCAKTSLPKENKKDILYSYDFNNLNISVFNQKRSKIDVPNIKKNIEGYPLNLIEENKLISLLKL